MRRFHPRHRGTRYHMLVRSVLRYHPGSTARDAIIGHPGRVVREIRHENRPCPPAVAACADAHRDAGLSTGERQLVVSRAICTLSHGWRGERHTLLARESVTDLCGPRCADERSYAQWTIADSGRARRS